MIKLNSVYSDEQIEDVARLAYEIWNQHFPPIIGQAQVDYMVEKFQSVPALAEQINNGYRYNVIQNNNKPVGYVGVKTDTKLHQVQLSKFYIIKTMRGQGVGRKVLNLILASEKKLGINKIWLTVNKYNITAISAYKRMGFEIAADIVVDIGHGYVMDDFKMEKSIT